MRPSAPEARVEPDAIPQFLANLTLRGESRAAGDGTRCGDCENCACRRYGCQGRRTS